MGKKLIFSLLLLLVLTSLASAQLGLITEVKVNDQVLKNSSSVTNYPLATIYIGEEDKIQITFNATQTSRTVRVHAILRHLGEILETTVTEPFTIRTGSVYTKTLNLKESSPIEIYEDLSLDIFIEDPFHVQVQNFGAIARIPLYECKILNTENGKYLLRKDLYDSNFAISCFMIIEEGISLDLGNHHIKNNDSLIGIVIDNDPYDITVTNGVIDSFTHGINAQDARNLTLSHLTIINSENTGILLEDTESSTISYNHLSSNRVGIEIEDDSYYNNIHDNFIVGSEERGLTLYDSGENTIYNNFFNNPSNVFVDENSHYFNIPLTPGKNIINGSFIGGNVWLQPNGLGFSQICGDSDRNGICDSAYTVPQDNIDNLPLVWNGLGSLGINFIQPTPSHGSHSLSNNLAINMSGFAEEDYYTFLDFNNDVLLWVRMDDLDSNGNPLDLSTYSNNGIKEGEPLQTEGFGEAFTFDGEGDKIVIQDSPSLDIDSEFSVSFWFKGDSSVKPMSLISKFDGTANEIAWFVDVATGGRCGLGGAGLDFYVSENGRSNDRVYIRDCSSTYQDGEWHHIVGVFNPGKEISLYVDGERKGAITGSVANVNGVYTNNHSLQIASGIGYSNDYNGSIDEVLLFKRSLTEQEVLALYPREDQYFREFVNLSNGLYSLIGHIVDKEGNRDSTEERIIGIGEEIIPVSNCQQLNQTNKYYLLVNNISIEQGTCFRITKRGITLDMNYHSITGVTSREDGIEVENFALPMRDITIKNGQISRVDEGISASHISNLTISGISLTNVDEAGIALGNVDNSYIYDNEIVSTSFGIESSSSSNNHIYNNIFDRNSFGIDIYAGELNIIENNYIDNSEIYGLSLDNTKLNKIVGNEIINSDRGDFDLDASSEDECNNELVNNTWSSEYQVTVYTSQVNLSHQSFSGLILCNADNSILNNVSVLNDKQASGLKIILTDNSNFSHILVENTYEGIHVDFSNNNLFNNIVSSSNWRSGLYIKWSSNGNTIINGIINNQLRGVDLDGNNNILQNLTIESYRDNGILLEGSNNTITGNHLISTIEDSIGILLDNQASSNLIYNNLFRNFVNIEMEGNEANFWNVPLTQGPNIIGGHMIGGNFWGDLGGNGFSETCLNKEDDGICDEPYQIEENNIDYYPLTDPYPPLPIISTDVGVINISFYPSQPQLGQQVTATALIKNLGTLATNISYASGITTPVGGSGGACQYCLSLEPEEEYNLSINFPATHLGQYTYEVYILGSTVPDPYPNNNNLSKSFTL